jgi:hypothetical protein
VISNTPPYLRSFGVPGCLFRCALLALVCPCIANASQLQPAAAVLVQDKTPPGLFGLNKASAGTLASVEAALREGLSAGRFFGVLTRSQFDAVLAEQDLAYKNVVNDRARLGQLSGTDFIVVAELLADRKNTRSERISAYGVGETQTKLSSDANLALSVLDVSTGKIVAQRVFAATLGDSHGALPAVLGQSAAWLGSLRLPALEKTGGRFALSVAPTMSGAQVRGLDVFVDGNFEANTPADLSVENGVREITLKRADKVLWSNKIRVARDSVLEPDLGN